MSPFAQQRVLIAHHAMFTKHRDPLLSPEFYYLTSSPYQAPRVINVPMGAGVDMAGVLKALPRGWYPDLFIAKVDAFCNILPRNVGVLDCPRVLVLGDTQHGERPLETVIQYAQSEPYDFHVSDHKRHHLWYFHMAGIDNLYFLPGLFLKPFSPSQVTFSSSAIPRGWFEEKIVFVGQTGNFHPRRLRLLERARQSVPGMFVGRLPQADSLLAYHLARAGLNISLNGDLNLRIFEIVSAQGVLITDQLGEESGLSSLFAPGEEFLSFDNADELQQRLRFCLDEKEAAWRIGARGFSRYAENYAPAHMERHLFDLVGGRSLPPLFTTTSINRIRYFPKPEYSAARIRFYQWIQELHRTRESLHIALDRRVGFVHVEDLLDLPRISIRVSGHDPAYRHGLEEYLAATGQGHRVQWLEGQDLHGQLPATVDPDTLRLRVVPRADASMLGSLNANTWLFCDDGDGLAKLPLPGRGDFEIIHPFAGSQARVVRMRNGSPG